MNKQEEENYQYWQNEFDGHSDYMTAIEDNEYAQIRTEIFKYIDDGDSILDVGCATGNNLEEGEHLGFRFHYKGTDYVENFIEANKKRRPDIDWEVQDARELYEKDKSFDVVILYDVLDNMPDWQKAIDEAVRVAKKRIIITMWCDRHMEDKENYLVGKVKHLKSYHFANDKCRDHYFIVGSLC
jgi:ubiquinone/menaquinone biosynthesis C-methylase UbiE